MAPMPNLLKLLLSPSGRIGRKDYLIGLMGLVIIFTLYGLLINALGRSMAGFFAVLAFPFVILQIAYSVFGKRLHDMGRTLWPMTGLICAMLMAMIIVMLVYGGAEYFAAYSEYSRDNPPPEEVVEQLNAEFKPRQAEGESVLSFIIFSLLAGFTLWLGVAKPEAGANAYGPPVSK